MKIIRNALKCGATARMAWFSFVIFLLLVSITNHSFSQTLEEFLYSKGVYHMGQASHASNSYVSGTYDIYQGYIDISIKSRDNIFGASIQTDLRLVRGPGDLFFSDIIVLNDNDFVKPFDAFELQASLMISLIKSVDQATYNDMRNSVKESLNTDFENWTGKMWALLAINLDYYEYLLKGK